MNDIIGTPDDWIAEDRINHSKLLKREPRRKLNGPVERMVPQEDGTVKVFIEKELVATLYPSKA